MITVDLNDTHIVENLKAIDSLRKTGRFSDEQLQEMYNAQVAKDTPSITEIRQRWSVFICGGGRGNGKTLLNQALNDMNVLLDQLSAKDAELDRLTIQRDDYKFFCSDVVNLPNCNVCGVKNECKYAPKLGQKVRFNCPLYLPPKAKEDA
jgi:hypothetical protein